MSGIRVLVGTRKGGFILSADGKRNKWTVDRPHFAGWEVFHMKGSPVDPERTYASQTSSWFCQIIQRSNDGGTTWHQPGLEPGDMPNFDEMSRTAQCRRRFPAASSRTLRPRSASRSPPTSGTTAPCTRGNSPQCGTSSPTSTTVTRVCAGVKDAVLFESTDGGESWHELAGLRGHDDWMPALAACAGTPSCSTATIRRA